MDNDNSYLKFIDSALELAKDIPKYFSRFSNKLFSNQQKIVLLVLKQKLKATYRSLVEWLKIAKDVRLMLGLTRIPHHTTLVKFAKKIKADFISLLLPYRQAEKVAIDYSGFELEAKSFYYRKTCFIRRKTKRFMRLAIAADVDKQLIMKHIVNKKCGNDNTEFINLLKELKVSYVLADKGYDARSNRKFVFMKLNAIPQIPFRKISGKDGIINGTANYLFDDKIYHQRSKVETIFSVIKRKYGSVVKARSLSAQKAELICKLIAYNIDRLITLYNLLIIGFQQSPILDCGSVAQVG